MEGRLGCVEPTILKKKNLSDKELFPLLKDLYFPFNVPIYLSD